MEKRTHNIQKIKRIQQEEREAKLRVLDPHLHQRELKELVRQVGAADKMHNRHTPEFFEKVPYLEAVYLVSGVYLLSI